MDNFAIDWSWMMFTVGGAASFLYLFGRGVLQALILLAGVVGYFVFLALWWAPVVFIAWVCVKIFG